MGISNVTIENFIGEENDDFQRNLVGVFSSNRTTPFLNFLKMMKRKGSHYPFIILNTERTNSPGTHWWSILNIYPRKQLFLFDSYGFLGFKAFIEQDDCGLINKILYNTKKFNKNDNIVNLVTVTFSGENYEKLSQNQITKLISTAADLFYLINEFAILNRIKIEVILHIADDQLQNKTSNILVGYFNFTSTKTFSNHSKKVK